MRLRTYILTLALLATVALPALAQKHYTEIEYPPLPDFTIPEAERVELDNGMILFLIEDHELPLVSMTARIGGGSTSEPADKVGLASVTGTAMRTGGTTSMSGDEVNERLENIAASVEIFIGRSSGSAFMSTLKEYTDEVLDVFADILMHPAFPEDKIDLAKTQQKSGISRRNDNSQQIAFREFDELIYGSDHPYARSPEYATIDAIERDDLVAFHQQFFHPNNVILGVWGDFDTDAMVAKIDEAFKDWPTAEGFQRPAPPSFETESDYGVNFAAKDDVTQSTILLGHPGEVRRDDPDYSAITVMNQVLSGGFSSRLFQNVRDDQGLAYAVFGAYTAGYDQPGRFYAGVMTKSETTVEAAQSVLREVEKMREAPPTEEEMTQAIDGYLNSFVFNFDTRREIVNRMMTYEYYDYPKDFLDQEKAGIENVTRDDVLRVSQRYLKPDRVQILAVGKAADFGEPLSTLGEVIEIDITIPTAEEPAPEATEETIARGRELLNGAIATLGGQDAFSGIETMKVNATQTSTTPDNMQVESTLEITVALPDRARLQQSMPMGEVAIIMNGDTFTLHTPQGTMPAPPPIQQQMLGSLWRDIGYLFANQDRVEVQYLGQEEAEGQQAEVVQVTPPGDAGSFKLYLNAETLVPFMTAYQGIDFQTGSPQQSREVLSDFRGVGSVTLPFRSTTYTDGELAAETVIETIEINVAVDESMFN